MTDYRLGLLKGDGIGPEVVAPSIALADRVGEACGVTFDWVTLPMGWESIHDCGDPMPASTRDELANTHGWVMGPHDSASYPKEWHESRRPMPGGELRHHYDLYANIRPAKNLPGVESIADTMDVVVVRENTEGMYPDRNMHIGNGEFMPSPDLAMVIGVYKRPSVERIIETGFRMASQRTGHVSIVHKANALPLTTGMYVEVAREVAERYPDVKMDDYHVDAIAAVLVRKPEAFDVIVADNLFGDILSDLAGELVGGLGVAGALNSGDDHAMAQATHGSAPDIAGKGIANPIGMMVSTNMLLHWIGARHDDKNLLEAARLADDAIDAALRAGVTTTDLGGSASTAEFGQACLDAVAARV